MILKARGIQSRFLVIVTLMTLLLVGAVCTGVGWISSKYQNEQAREFIKELRSQQTTQETLLMKGLDEKGEALAAILAENGSSLIIGYDFDTLASMANNGAKNSDVAFVTFYDTEGKALTKEPAEIGKNVKVIEKEVAFEGEKIGSVRLGLDTTSVKQAAQTVEDRLNQAIRKAKMDHWQALHAIITQGGATAVIGVLLLCLVLSWSLKRLIIKPLRNISGGLEHEAEMLAAASDQVSTASESLADGASQQAASIEETSSSLEEMGSMTKQNAGNARQAAGIVQNSVGKFNDAGEAMQRLTASMQEISRASEETQKIIKTIDEIAFQTNLLSLNAAVEAARAGEAGAGFAVVADEVRNLAMRAAEAARNTADIIEGTVKKIQDGSRLVDETNRSFEEVLQDSEKVAGLVSEIAAASGEQSQGIDQIAVAVSQIDEVVQQNAANAEQSAAASRELRTQERRMSDFVTSLIQLVNGSGARSKESKGGGGADSSITGETAPSQLPPSPSRRTNGSSALMARQRIDQGWSEGHGDGEGYAPNRDESDRF